jgi:3-oxoacyl-[acyl-carrier protein] reductase
MASSGADVAVNYRSAADEAEAVAQKARAHGVQAITVQADVSQPEEVDRLVNTVADQLGPVDILVNNAGHNWLRPIMDITVEDWDRTLDLNLRSHFLAAKAVLPGMIERGWGRIIGNTSISGQRGGLSGDVDYSAAKAGIMGFTRCLARHVADKGITVNAVAPGYIDTEHLASVDSILVADKLQQLLKTIPVGRFGTVEECGAIFAFLASDYATYITGETVTANGGVHIA